MPRHRAKFERSRWTEGEARQLLTAWAGSGQSMAAYARAQGVSAQRLSWWRDRLQGWSGAPTNEPGDIQLIPAEVVHARAPLAAGKVTIRLRDGLIVEVSEATPAWIAALVTDLEVRR